jgi:hypothetical protein
VKALNWALILVGGGLVVYAVRRLSAPAAEPGDPDYDPDLSGWDSELGKVEKAPAYDQSDWGPDTVHPHDLNDGV